MLSMRGSRSRFGCLFLLIGILLTPGAITAQPSRSGETSIHRFVRRNMDSLARQIAVGSGDTLETVGVLLRVEEPNRDAFYATLQAHFADIFPEQGTSVGKILVVLRAYAAHLSATLKSP